MNKKRIHQQQSRRKQICSERLQVPKPQPEVSDEELDRRALESLEGKPLTKGAGQCQ